MDTMPTIKNFADGSKYWENNFGSFDAKIYLPSCDLPTDIINYAFMTPYLLVFEEHRLTAEEAKQFADEKGFSKIAKEYGSSVVFISPATGNWNTASPSLFADLISNTKIGQYYENGVTKMRDRFTGNWGSLYIRGALHRSFLYGTGASADYIATHLLQTIEGDGLFGKGDITPALCCLENLSVLPAPARRDIPVISVGNNTEINKAFQENLDYVLCKEKADYYADFIAFGKKFRRMVGYLNIEPDLTAMGMAVEPQVVTLTTASDNRGDDKDTTKHKVGYVAYYNKKIMETGQKVPTVLCFHGGGDSAMCMVALSDWHLVVNKYDFLLISIENHLNSTATEMMELLKLLKEKYPIDEERIYSTGFSMGGCKTWDMFQEYPTVFAAVAPMDATFPVGTNAYGQPVENYNQDTILPVFYVGGELTPIPELPFQEEKCRSRMEYVLKVNRAKTPYNVTFEDRENWTNKIWGIDGDVICKAKDDNRNCILTMHLFESENGCCYSIFGSGSNQAHEMRHLNCENAWKFFSQFRRKADGTLVGGNMQDVINLYQ